MWGPGRTPTPRAPSRNLPWSLIKSGWLKTLVVYLTTLRMGLPSTAYSTAVWLLAVILILSESILGPGLAPAELLISACMALRTAQSSYKEAP